MMLVQFWIIHRKCDGLITILKIFCELCLCFKKSEFPLTAEFHLTSFEKYGMIKEDDISQGKSRQNPPVD